jgi:anaerobic ribonucleoside-triphosphate reductase
MSAHIPQTVDQIDHEIKQLQIQYSCAGKRCQVVSRVVGYYQPVDNWNQGKREEFAERKTFDVPKEVTCARVD